MNAQDMASALDSLNGSAYFGKIGISRQRIIECLEKYYNIPYIDLKKTPADPSLSEIFDMQRLKKEKIIPYNIDRSAGVVSFAIADMLAQQLIENITVLCRQRGYRAHFSFAFPSEIEQKYDESLKDTPNTGESAEWISQAIGKGVRVRASDIHIEPQEKGLRIRYRVDGLLSIQEHQDVADDFAKSAMSRLKVISGMDIAERRRPQDGRIDSFEYDGKKYDLRVSTILTANGEKAVIRIFDKESRTTGFSELGFSSGDEIAIKKMLSNPYGIIYLGGPTGSGKTTTLYAMIECLNSDDINIYAVEDPIEKTIVGVNQIQLDTKANIGYPEILKALLRQDPDILVVGEIRDQETAELSVRSSLTGHLVLSTVHANNSIDIINRLYNMSIEPYLLSATALGFISQRLVRILCPHCKIQHSPDPPEMAWIERMSAAHNIDPQGTFYTSSGCHACSDTGYKGRTAVTEILSIVNRDQKECLARRDIKSLYELSLKSGFVPLDLGGLLKVKEGVTSIREALRVLSSPLF